MSNTSVMFCKTEIQTFSSEIYPYYWRLFIQLIYHNLSLMIKIIFSYMSQFIRCINTDMQQISSSQLLYRNRAR